MDAGDAVTGEAPASNPAAPSGLGSCASMVDAVAGSTSVRSVGPGVLSVVIGWPPMFARAEGAATDNRGAGADASRRGDADAAGRSVLTKRQ